MPVADPPNPGWLGPMAPHWVARLASSWPRSSALASILPLSKHQGSPPPTPTHTHRLQGHNRCTSNAMIKGRRGSPRPRPIPSSNTSPQGDLCRHKPPPRPPDPNGNAPSKAWQGQAHFPLARSRHQGHAQGRLGASSDPQPFERCPFHAIYKPTRAPPHRPAPAPTINSQPQNGCRAPPDCAFAP